MVGLCSKITSELCKQVTKLAEIEIIVQNFKNWGFLKFTKTRQGCTFQQIQGMGGESTQNTRLTTN